MQTNSEVKKIRGCPQVYVICDKDRHVAFVVLATKCFLKFSYEPDRYICEHSRIYISTLQNLLKP